MKRLVLLLPLLVLLGPAPAWGQATNRAGVVVRFGDGSIQTSCVSFATETISGLDLLRGSGLDVIAQSAGNNAAVCKIGGDGCNYPAESCLACKFGAGGQGQYWAYWQLADGGWRYGQLGAGVTRVRSGGVDGWAYGAGNVQAGAQPPVITYDEICPTAPVAEPTAVPPPPTAAPTARPTARPTVPPTARPTVRPTAPPTARPTAVPTAQPTEAIVAAAPTATPEPSPTPELPSATPQPSPTPEPPTATSQPPTSTTGVPTTAPTAAATAAPPTATPVVAGAAPDAAPPANIGGYLVFGAMLLAIVGAILVALRRRRA